MKMNTTIYINGVPHRCSELAASFFADTPQHPGIPCSQHRIGSSAVQQLKIGAKVKTLGNWYSLHPESYWKPEPKPEPEVVTTQEYFDDKIEASTSKHKHLAFYVAIIALVCLSLFLLLS
jgi:hypothetical protein